MTNLLIIVSGLLTLLSPVPYIIDVARKNTKPRVVTWFTWTILSLIAGFASLSDGNNAAAVLGFSGALATASIFVLALVYDGDRSIARFDIICQFGAIIGLILWAIFSTPSIAIIATIFIDLVGALPTLKHSWAKPFEETWLAFAIGATGSGLAIIASESFTITGIANPIYWTFMNLVFVSVILLRRRATLLKFHNQIDQQGV